MKFIKKNIRLDRIQFILFLILLILWNVFTPVLEGADEPGHFCHADYIAHRNKLPNLNVEDGCFLVYQPLYYLTLVPVIKLFNRPEFSPPDIASNPNFQFLRKGEYAQFVHNRDELTFRWNNFQLMIHMLRVVSSVFGVGIFILGWKTAKLVFKSQKQQTLSLLLFFNPMLLHIFSTLTNVTLVVLLSSAFIFIEIYFTDKKKPLKLTFLQGLIFGLGLITKVNILGLTLGYIYLLFINWRKRKDIVWEKFKTVTIFLSGVVLTFGWYLVRSLKLYGEPLEVGVAAPFAGASFDRMRQMGIINYWSSFPETLFRTFWSGFGAITVRFPEVINLLLLLCVLWLGFGVMRKWQEVDQRIKIAGYYLLSIFVTHIVVNFRMEAFHAKDIFTAYVPLSIFFGVGLTSIFRILKQGSIGPRTKWAIYLLGLYFFAKYELVRLLKYFLQSVQAFGFYHPESVQLWQIINSLLVKALITFVAFGAVKIFLLRFKFSSKNIILASIFLFLSNIIILAYAVNLFYVKFL